MTHPVPKKDSKQWRKMSNLACFCAVSKNRAFQRLAKGYTDGHYKVVAAINVTNGDNNNCQATNRGSKANDEIGSNFGLSKVDGLASFTRFRRRVGCAELVAVCVCAMEPGSVPLRCEIGSIASLKVWPWNTERGTPQSVGAAPPPRGRRGFLSGIGVWRSVDL